MYNEEKAMLSANAIDERPDFGCILETLQKEAACIQENADAITDLANRVKPIESLKELSSDKPVPLKDPNCLVEYLWHEINKIQIANQRLNDTYRHLSRVIGN